jgi:hypothetical protein
MILTSDALISGFPPQLWLYWFPQWFMCVFKMYFDWITLSLNQHKSWNGLHLTNFFTRSLTSPHDTERMVVIHACVLAQTHAHIQTDTKTSTMIETWLCQQCWITWSSRSIHRRAILTDTAHLNLLITKSITETTLLIFYETRGPVIDIRTYYNLTHAKHVLKRQTKTLFLLCCLFVR